MKVLFEFIFVFSLGVSLGASLYGAYLKGYYQQKAVNRGVAHYTADGRFEWEEAGEMEVRDGN